MRSIFLLLFALLLAACSSGAVETLSDEVIQTAIAQTLVAQSSEAGTSPTETRTVDDSHQNNVVMKVEEVEEFTEIENSMVKPIEGGRFVAYLIAITNNNDFVIDGGSSDPTNSFSVLTNNSFTINAENTSSDTWRSNRQVWAANEIPSGETRRGWIVFSLPQGETVEKIVFVVLKENESGWYEDLGEVEVVPEINLSESQPIAPTPTLTNTPEPTDTPKPTPTDKPDFEPFVIYGMGDMVQDIVKGDEPALVQIIHFGIEKNFAVWNIGKDGKEIGLLVNTIGLYNGTRPLDFFKNEHTVRFKVEADTFASWSIFVKPISEITRIEIPGIFEGEGDDVVYLDGENPDLLSVDAISAKSNFAIYGFTARGDRELLINEIAPYQGTVMLDSDTSYILEVIATGEWVIDVSTK